MVFLAIFLIIAFSGSVFGAVVLDKKFGQMLPLTMFSIVMVVYIFGLAGLLKIGVYAVFTLATVLYLLSALKAFKDKKFRQYISNIITPGAVFTLLVTVVFLSGTIGMRAFQWDEISHWVSCVKRMYIANDFTSNPQLHAIFQSYPPAMSVLQYTAMVIKGEFAEWATYFCYFFFSVSLFAPFFEKFKIKNVFRIAALGFGLMLAIISFNQEAFVTAYIDLFLSLMFGFMIAYSFCFDCVEDKLCNATFALAAATTVLSKDAGMLFAVFMCIAFAVAYIAENKGGLKNKKMVQFVPVITPFAALMFAKFSWKMNLVADGSVLRFDGSYDFGEFITILMGKDGGYRSDVLKSFTDTFFSSLPSETTFTIDYNILIIIAIVGFGVLLHLYGNRSAHRDITRKTIVVFSVVTAAVYVVGMLASYMYKFSEFEALKLASVDRYMTILLTAFVVAEILILTDYLSESKSGRGYIYVLATVYILFSLANTSYVKQLTQRVFINRSIDMTQGYEPLAEKVSALGLGDKKVALMAQGDSGYIGLLYAYYLYPVNVDTSVGYDPYAAAQTPQNYIQSLVDNGYEYIILYNFGETFSEDYADIFADGSTAERECIYTIDGESMKLVKLA